MSNTEKGEILVVASKVKAYIKSKGYSTSATSIEKLSAQVRDLIEKAIERTKSDNRKTVMDRDF